MLYTWLVLAVHWTLHALPHHSALCARDGLHPEYPFSACPLKNLLFILQSPVQCWLFCESCPHAILGRMICHHPSGPTASFLYYTISKLRPSGFRNSETLKQGCKIQAADKKFEGYFGLSLIHSIQYLLNAYCMLGTILNTGNRGVIRTQKPLFTELTI